MLRPTSHRLADLAIVIDMLERAILEAETDHERASAMTAKLAARKLELAILVRHHGGGAA